MRVNKDWIKLSILLNAQINVSVSTDKYSFYAFLFLS